MDPFIQNMIGTAVRWLLTMVGTWLVTSGILPSGSQTEWIAGTTAIVVALIWGLYQKFVAKKLLHAALTLPAGASVKDAQTQAQVIAANG